MEFGTHMIVGCYVGMVDGMLGWLGHILPVCPCLGSGEMLKGPHQNVESIVSVLGTGIVCGARGCIGIGVGFGVGCSWISGVVVFVGRLMRVGFGVGIVVGW